MDIQDIDDLVQSHVYTQDYATKVTIEGVKLIPVKYSVGDEGDFSELMRLDDKGEVEAMPGFKLAQINRTQLFPGSVKAWHLHLKQNEFWYLPPQFQMMVGLWDLRKHSQTVNKTMRVNVGGGTSCLLYVPCGVAHGAAVFGNRNIELFYFVNQKFDIKDPDEKRIRWYYLGKEFWSPERD